MFLILIILFYNTLINQELANQNQQFSYGMALSVNFFEGHLYCGTGNGYNGGLYKFEDNIWKLVLEQELLSNRIYDLLPTEKYLLVATEKGIFGLDKNSKIFDLNKGLPNEVYLEGTQRVLKIIENQSLLILTLDYREIYISNKDSISWEKANINFNRFIYDFDYYRGDLYLSIDREGVIKYNLDNRSFTRIHFFDNEFIFNINSASDFIHFSSGFENYLSFDGTEWKNFNSYFKIDTDIIRKLIEVDSKIYCTDNINLYFSSDKGENWFFQNIVSQVKKPVFTQELFAKDDVVYMSVDDFGIIKIEENEVSILENNVFNFRVENIKIFGNDTFYHLSTLNHSFIYKINEKKELIYQLFYERIKDFYVYNNSIIIMQEYSGLIASNNNILWSIIPLPSSYDFREHKLLKFDDYIMMSNIDFENKSYFTLDEGKNWEEVEIFSNDSILKIIENINYGFALSINNIFLFDKLKKEWDNKYSSKNLSDIIFDDNLIIIEDGKIITFDEDFNLMLEYNNLNAIKLISYDLAYFKDNSIKQLINNNWTTIFEFNYLTDKDINSIIKYENNHLQIATNHLGLFDLYLDNLSVNNNDSYNIKYENNIYFSDIPFDIKVINLLGNTIYQKNNTKEFNINSLIDEKYIIIFTQKNDIFIQKIIQN
jgi:hypothetical protein